MAKQTHPLQRRFSSKVNAGILAGMFLFAVAVLLVALQMQDSLFTSHQSTPPITFKVSPMPTSPPVATPTPNIQTYTSQNLGISFQYNAGSAPGDRNYLAPVYVKEIGDKVYLYQVFQNGKNNFDTNNLSVQVLSKDPSQTLEEAVRQQFLQGYSAQTCLFKDNSGNTPGMPASDIRLSVQPVDMNQNMGGVPKTDCPASLIGDNQNSYFLMDTAHPGKFLFFHISGGNLPGNHGTWDMSVKILN